MDSLTLTILIVLLFLLVWLGIMIFTTKPEDEKEESVAEAQPQLQPQLQQRQVNPVNEIPSQARVENGLIASYERRIAELQEKIRSLEMRPTNDKLIDWLADLRRENEFLKLKLAQMNSPPKEDENLREELEKYKERVKKLERELEEMKSNLDYYRLMLNRLQGRYTVINKYNYRMCIRDPSTGEYKYELVKIPPDFDPFNPSYITKDGIEVYEEHGIRIPTKLGDIIRQEFKKDMVEIGLHR